MKNTVSFLFSLILLLSPVVVSAETVVRTGDAISVDEEQAVQGDYYVSVGPVGNTSMSGTVMGDMYALGGSVTVNGTVEEDLAILSGVSQLHASVTDDVRIVSGEVIVAEDIGGDLFVIAGDLKILSTASIGGNVYFFGSEALVEGKIAGSVFGNANRMRIDGQIGGDLDVQIYDLLTLGSKTSVTGDVRYVSGKTLVRATEATIEGELVKQSDNAVNSRDEVRSLLIPVFIVLFAALSIYLLFRRELTVAIDSAYNHLARNALVGLAVIMLAPIASIMLMVTVLGFVIGILLTALSVILLVAGYAISGIVCGAYIAKMLKKEETVSLTWILVGTLVLQLALLVPLVGPLLVIFVFALSVGILTTSLYRLLQ